ncbi:hypothetical protein TWF679_011183 [Orbilia oligospora]|uniref:U3 small nucleolar RNA-associated protein 11 n=2 Tax=Orbilia oligospora TaxID=2813651 RepID=A0A8H8UYR4_ORBOL|nr:hypothetical protein TWF679_011183 [Orbilia oligospora]
MLWISSLARAPRMSEQLKDKLRTCEKVTWFLGCLKDVSSRIQHNFSLSVHVPLDPEVLNTWRLLDISKITEITVDIDWKINHPRDQYLQVRTEDGYDLDASYANTQLSHTLSTFLREAPNIRKLWISTSFDYYEGQKRGYGDLEASDSLEDLQDAFTSLSKLQILSIRGKFFHPSFFITPPDSTRTVIYEGVFSDKWFNQFCQCHFVNVTNMTVELTAQDPKFAMVQRNAEFEYSPYSVQDVAFTGIQNCRLELNGLEEVYADTLRQAVLRRNRGLHIPSKERLSGSIAENARKIAEASLNHACSNYISIASARLTSTPKTLDNETEESQIQNCVQQCIRTLPKSLENLESWEVATSDSKKMLVQSEARIKNLIMMAAPQFVLESTEERLNGNENPDPDEVTMKLLKNMMKVLKNEKAWRKNQKKTLRFSRQCRAQLEREIEAGVKIATGEPTDTNPADDFHLCANHKPSHQSIIIKATVLKQSPQTTMSSMRNAIQRRNHKERSQISSRQRYGHLEKHKDYALRAQDYNSKKARLKILKSKASERNPDEFYFGMVNARTRDGGVLVKERGAGGNDSRVMGMDRVRGLKIQDKAYLRVMGDVERRKREKLEEELVFVGVDGVSGGIDGGKKKLFDEEGNVIKPAKGKKKKVVDEDEMDWEDEDDDEDEGPKPTKAEQKAAKARMAKYKELEARMKREAELRGMERELDAQREFMGKSAPRMGLTKEGKRWFNNARKR